jgi:hypothetical protein
VKCLMQIMEADVVKMENVISVRMVTRKI